jgi:flagellar basal body P-ring protein FlgI
MKPTQPGAFVVRFACGFWLAAMASLVAGCSTEAVNLQSPEDDFDLLESNVKLVGDFAFVEGIAPVKLHGIALVTQLANTGSDPTDTEYRRALISEMQTRGVPQPNQVLKSPTTAMVVVTGFMRPGIRKGDHFDVLVESLVDDATTSLKGGWLMETRLSEMRRTPDEVLREGDLLGLTQGWLLVDPRADVEKDPDALRRARILGGGVATKSRDLWIMLREQHKSIGRSADIGKAINARFVIYNKGVQEGVANPTDDVKIDLLVHPRYKDNIARYVAVIRSIAVRETPVERASRMRLLERQLLDPITSARAALELEAIGVKGMDILKKGLASTNQEVRFYSAEALAYLDEKTAAAPLAEIAHEEPAFRAYALTALSAMKDVGAYEQLRKLLGVTSAETRYGAFRALSTWDAQDPLIRGEGLGGKFSYHMLDVGGPPMIHLTGSYRPEVVLFGRQHQLITPVKLQAGKAIDIVGDGNEISVVRYLPDKPVERRQVTNDVDALVRAVVELGGDYGGLVQMFSEAKAKKALTSRLEIDALPRSDRGYDRDAHPADHGEYADDDADHADGEEVPVSASRHRGVSSPAPELFGLPEEQPSSPRKPAKNTDDSDTAEDAE